MKALLALLCVVPTTIIAQSTSFTYQGRLTDGGNPANGNYNLTFKLFDSAVSGHLIGSNGPTAYLLSNGIFTAAVDFGSVFTGTNYWLEISVQNGTFATFALSPRQPITFTPYSQMASVAATLSAPIPTSLVSGLGSIATQPSNAFIGSGSGFGTNLTFYPPDNEDFHAALTLYAAPNNIGSENLNLFGQGTNGSPIVHFMNTDGNATDLGLWSKNFGGGYSGKVIFDLYDAFDITRRFGPAFQVQATGIYGALVGDSGVVSHPLFRVDATNLDIHFFKASSDDRDGTAGSIFHAPSGTWRGLVADAAPNPPGGPGTMSISSSGVVTGDGTTIFTVTFLNTRLFYANNVRYHVIYVNSDNVMHVAENTPQPAGTAYVPYPDSGTFYGIAGPNVRHGVHMQDGELLISADALPSVWLVDDALNYEAWGLVHNFDRIALQNSHSGGGVKQPFYIMDGTGDVGISGKLSIAGTTNQITFGATNAPPANSNAIIWVSVQISGDTNQYRIPLMK